MSTSAPWLASKKSTGKEKRPEASPTSARVTHSMRKESSNVRAFQNVGSLDSTSTTSPAQTSPPSVSRSAAASSTLSGSSRSLYPARAGRPPGGGRIEVLPQQAADAVGDGRAGHHR